jgi:GMP synthase-like glutamine amidotransferase
MRWHCLQHLPDEDPGYAADWLAAHGHSLTFTRLFEPAPIFPALAEFDGLLILGGAMSVHDEAAFPWLREEKAFLQAALRAGKITLAICLGAQLVAQALGGEVRPNPEPEIGFWTVRFSAKALAHPLLRGWPDKAALARRYLHGAAGRAARGHVGWVRGAGLRVGRWHHRPPVSPRNDGGDGGAIDGIRGPRNGCGTRVCANGGANSQQAKIGLEGAEAVGSVAGEYGGAARGRSWLYQLLKL